ncbi:guanylate kinase [Moniliophthora roreri]|nr:guanylate kinase [Moniliophthora roreri]
MSTANGTTSPLPSPSEPRRSSADIRISLDSQRSNTSSPSIQANGVDGEHPQQDAEAHDDANLDPITRLQRELERTREEKENLATQYRNLVAKLTTMRNTLGNKLKQDAEELDRREQLVQQLTAQNEDLLATVETLKEELITSHEETERVSNELDSMRNRALHENAQEALIRDRELRNAQAELERCRIKLEEQDLNEMREKALLEEARSNVETLETDLKLAQAALERAEAERKAEKERADNLQSVLADFQAAKEHELRQAVKDYESQLVQATQSLAEYKHRALTAEMSLEESQTNSSRTQELEKEVKEKNLLIGKLRHEAVIINEHLMEALRRLRRNSSDHNVDRRLVTNVLLSFLTTPRADAKRFEMLSLLATILSWNDAEREKAGLQRSNANTAPSTPSSFWRRPSSSGPPGQLQKTDETESFSRLWVEFLLTEAASGESPAPSTATSPKREDTSLPNTPTLGNFSPSSLSPTKRAPSFSSVAMASTPNLSNLSLGSPPSSKGKGKALSESEG